MRIFLFPDIFEIYDWNETAILGAGLNGYVKLCTHRKTNKNYALKTLKKFQGDKDNRSKLMLEIQMMSQLDHPNILRIHEYIETHEKIYLVMELCTGGHLLDRRRRADEFAYPERIACSLVRSMLRAVRCIHENGIIHRDLKLENFLFTTDSTSSELKMIDFGLAMRLRLGEKLTSPAAGTSYYVSPEMVEGGGYDHKSDVWAIGVITFKLISGALPFYGPTDGKLYFYHLKVVLLSAA